MKQPHEHIAAAYQGRNGSPYQTFKRKRSGLVRDIVIIAALGLAVIVMLCALPGGGW